MKISVGLFALLLAFGSAHADWQLDGEQSSLSFVSIKNIDIAESHRFARITGSLATDGQFQVVIALDSVDTAISIRDERMREFLFDTPNYPLALVTGQIEMAALSGLEVGHSINLDSSFELAMHGNTTTLAVKLEVTRLTAKQFLVLTRQPVLVNATLLGLGEGLEKLQQIAGLTAISKAVPVYFSLRFSDLD